MIKKLIKKEKKQLIALFISLISLIIFVDVCLELKTYWKNKKDKK